MTIRSKEEAQRRADRIGSFQKEHRRFRGTIARLSVENIHVPLEHRPAVDAALTQKALGPAGQETPRYAVELAYGRRCEPWIVAIKALEKLPPSE